MQSVPRLLIRQLFLTVGERERERERDFYTARTETKEQVRRPADKPGVPARTKGGSARSAQSVRDQKQGSWKLNVFISMGGNILRSSGYGIDL